MNFAEQSFLALHGQDWVGSYLCTDKVNTNSFTEILKKETFITPFASTVSYKRKRTRGNSNTQGHTENPAFFDQDFNEKILK